MTLLPRLDDEEREILARKRDDAARIERVNAAMAEVERTHRAAYQEIAASLEKLKQELGTAR